MKYSCIIGTYNPNKEWLNRAIDSAIGLFNEIIIVDDGSNDQSYITDIKDKLDDARVVNDVIGHLINEGFWAAKNTAIEHCHGDIVCTLDDDDYFDRDGVAKLKQFIEDNPDDDIYHFKLQEFGLSNGIYGGGASSRELGEYNSIPGISWYKRSLWEQLGGFKAVRAEDWNFWLRAFKAGKGFSYFPEIVYNFNVRSDSVSHSWNIPFEQIRRQVIDNT